MSVPTQSIIDTRRDQMFPALEPAEIERLRRFGELRSYAAGEALVRIGEVGHGLTVVLAGEVEITQHDESGRREPIVTHGPGAFMGELAQLSGRPALVDAHAQGPVEALVIPPERLRALLVAEADLGERIMRALILRRVGLIETGAGGPVIVGRAEHGDVLRLRELPPPQRPPAPEARSRDRRGREGADRALPRRARAAADRPLPRRPAAAQSQRERARPLPRPGAADRSGPGLRRRDRRRRAGGPRRRRLCGVGRTLARWCSTAAPSAARRAPRRGSRTTSAFRPASPAWR